MELTKNDKARVFALYLGAKCRRFYRQTHKTYEDDTIVLDSENFHGISNGSGSYYYKLILKELSEISDEDATKVSILAGNEIENDFVPTGAQKQTFLDSLNSAIDMDILPYNVADYLRSKSYHIPYKGVNLFDAGIAIKQIKNS